MATVWRHVCAWLFLMGMITVDVDNVVLVERYSRFFSNLDAIEPMPHIP